MTQPLPECSQSLLDLSQLTVVIPTTGRRPLLAATSRYWNEIGVCVVIAERSDSTREENPYREFAQRTRDAVAKATTPVVAVIGDDDVYSVSGLRGALGVLLAQSWTEYVIGRGLYWYQQRKSWFPNCWSIYYREAYAGWSAFVDVPDTTPLERMSRGGFPLWSVARRDSMVRYLDLAARTLPRDPRLAENAMHLQGKIVMSGMLLDRLLWIRHEKTAHDRATAKMVELEPTDLAQWDRAIAAALELRDPGRILSNVEIANARPSVRKGARRNLQIQRRVVAFSRKCPAWTHSVVRRCMSRRLLRALGLKGVASEVQTAAPILARVRWSSLDADLRDIRLFESALQNRTFPW